MSTPVSPVARAVIAASSRRDAVSAPSNAALVPVTRATFDEVMVPCFAPAPLLEHLVTAGRLGRKTGKGFKDY